jgi:DNA-binding transcriptional MerR regulator
MRSKGEIWLEANECAARIGLSKRALRLYEEHGLIRPRRTEKGWRLYGSDEVARLHEILALKRLGLSLQRITALLQGRATDLAGILGIQHDLLAEQRERAEQGLALVRAAQAKLATGTSLTADELIRLAKEANMTETTTDTVAWRRYEQARPRTEVAINPRLFRHYEGFYRHPSGLTMTVSGEDGRFFLQLSGQPKVEMFAENQTEFFLKVVPAQITFSPNWDGQVNTLILHQGGHDTVASRISAAEAKRYADELEDRIRSGTPHPESEATLRHMIEEQQRGHTRYDLMIEELASLVREQLPMVEAELQSKGALRGLDFRKVGQGGADVYDAEFAKGTMEWGIGMTSDGKVHTLWMLPA